MISPQDVRRKAERLWQSQSPLRAEWKGESLFPLEIPFGKPSSRVLLDQFGETRDWIRELMAHSKEAIGHGYTVELSLWQHRQLGPQRIPDKIRIESLEDLCRLIGKSRDLATWRKASRLLGERLPELNEWIGLFPFKVLRYADDWPLLIKVVDFFRRHPKPALYIRQLQIPGVDTKFVEIRKKILQEVLDLTLPPGSIDSRYTALENGGFEQRYGLLYDEGLVRFRYLDSMICLGPFVDISLPLSHLAKNPLNCSTVFLVENKITALAFPPVKDAIVIFGSGFGISRLRDVPWLREKDIFYWGDIDTYGFSILDLLRSFLPHTQALLMNRETLMSHKNLWVEEPENSRFTNDLDHLTFEESELYDDLRQDRIGARLRLEQERIPFRSVLEVLGGIGF